MSNKSKETKKLVNYSQASRKNRPFKLLQQPQWNSNDSSKSVSPRPLTVTNISQDYQLKEFYDIVVRDESKQSSDDWIVDRKIDSVTFEGFLKTLIPVKPPGANEAEHFYKIYENDLYKFESDLLWYQNIIQERVDWLTQSSKEKFGVIRGNRPCILVDLSTQNCAFERLDCLKDDLMLLREDQLAGKTKIHLSSYGSDINQLWTLCQSVNQFSLEEAEEWIDNLQPSGCNNLLNAITSVAHVKDIDSLNVIIGTDPIQSFEIINDYLLELLSGWPLDVFFIAYDCKLPSTKMLLEDLSKQIGCRFHSYASPVNGKDAVVESSDISRLMIEYKRIVNIADKVYLLKQGDKVNNIKLIVEQKKHTSKAFLKNESSLVKRIDDLYCSDFLTLNVEKSSIQYTSSKMWLQKYGLRAKGLSLYQVMAPNAFSYVNSYISVLNKNVVSKNHDQVMEQMTWKDGSIKNIHIDPVMLENYKYYLQEALYTFKKRLTWLLEKSRQSIGFVKEDNVVIVLDMCEETNEYLAEIQLQVKTVLEQQMASRKSFNFICCGKNVKLFSKTMVAPTKENLCRCWRWLLDQPCEGERKILPALQIVYESFKEQSVDGLYMLYCGTPIEEQDIVGSFVEENVVGTNQTVNCIFIQPLASHMSSMTTSLAVKYWKNISVICNGTFHWTNSDVPIESDDVRLITEEMEKARNYYNKADMLVEKMKAKEKSSMHNAGSSMKEKSKKKIDVTYSITVPRQTALSQARIEMQRPKSAPLSIQEATPVKGFRPTSAFEHGRVKPLKAISKPTLEKKSKKRIIHAEKPAYQTFYTEIGNQTGSILTNFRAPASSMTPRDIMAAMKVNIPNSEKQCSSETWLSKYSLSHLKLNIQRVTSTCGHRSVDSSSKKNIQAKYCNILPSQNVNGIVKHLLINQKDLCKYEDNLQTVLKRYVKRLNWLMQGSRRVFGTLIEEKVVILIDTSGSMVDYLDNLKKNLISLIWDQIYKLKKSFNMVLFSSDVRCYSNHFVEATQRNCNEAVHWTQNITCGGETSTLKALKVAFQLHHDDFGIYLLTDGKPNSSTGMVLRETSQMNSNCKVQIHTISFNCSDSVANSFLQMLSHENNGRYHQYVDNEETISTKCDQYFKEEEHINEISSVMMVNHKVTHLSDDVKHSSDDVTPSSDDVRKILKEIHKAHKYIDTVCKFKTIL